MEQTQSKLLLLSGSPPGTGDVGEIILRDLALHYGLSNIHCTAVVPAGYTWKSDPRLDCLTVGMLPSTHIRAQRWGSGKWGSAGALVNFLTGFQRDVARLVDEIVADARANNVDRIFAVLNFPIMLAVAHRVAEVLKCPMATLVWDPPEYLCQQAGFDRLSRRLLLKEFQQCLAQSQQVAVVSESMRQDYAQLTDASIHILRYGLPMDFETSESANSSLSEDEWIIGFAGSMYSECAWRALLNALDQTAWRIAGRPVRLKVLAGHMTLAAQGPARIDFLGFRSPEEVQRVLALCHLNYMPQPFVSHLRTLCRYAFPTKLTNYLALGRPVFVHAPAGGALSAFFDSNPIGARSTSLEPQPIIDALEALLGDEQAYHEACMQVQVTARAYFDQPIFHGAIERVIGTDALSTAPLL